MHRFRPSPFFLLAALALAAVPAFAQSSGSYTFTSDNQTISGIDTTGGTYTLNVGPHTAISIYDVTGTGSLLVTGSGGDLNFITGSSYTGGTTVQNATLLGTYADSFGSGTVTLDTGNAWALFDRGTVSGQTVTNNFVVTSSGGGAVIGSFDNAPGTYFNFTGTLTLDRPTTLLDSGSDTSGRTSFSGLITGNVGTLAITGGRVTMEAANTFTGDVVVTPGSRLQLSTGSTTDSGNQILPIASNVTLQGSGSNLFLFGDSRIGSLSGGVDSYVDTYNYIHYLLTVGGNNQSTTFDGSFSDLRLKKVGSGTLTLTNSSNSQTENIIAGGTLALGDPNALGDGPITLAGGTLDLGGFPVFSNHELTITANSFIDFSGTSIMHFTDSHSADWSGTLTLLNFDAGVDHLFFGSDANGLTSAQLALISVAGYTVNGLDSSGDLSLTVSAIPEPSTYATLAGLGALGLALVRRRRLAAPKPVAA